MLVIIKRFSELDFDQLMAVYEEGNRESGRIRFPDDSLQQQLLKAEQEFADYLRYDFFSTKGASYCIWEEKNEYCSALRLEPYNDGLLLCALESKPSCRRKGYARALISAVLSEIDVPVYSHIRKNNRASVAAHTSCGFQLLREGAKFLDGSVSAQFDTYVFTK